jgi:hypothetical protein
MNNETYKILNIWNVASLFIGIAFLSIIHNYLFTNSVDLAHHYTLIDNISKYLFVNNSYSNLEEMAFYPSLSHWVTMLIGNFFNSNFTSISILTYASVLFLWIVIARIILDLPNYIPIAVMVLIVLFGLFTNFFNAFFGFEIIGNFFYSQLIGEASIFLIIYILYVSDINGNKYNKIILLPLSSLIIPYIHLLPAMQILVFISILVCIDFLYNKKINYYYLIIIGLSGLILIFHPAYKAMKLISENNGFLVFAFESTSLYILSLILVTFLLSIGIIILSHKSKNENKYALKFIAIFGFSSSILTIMQLIALQLGIGSDYAIKKHIFTIFSFLIIELSIIIAYFGNIFIFANYRYTISRNKKIFVSVLFAIVMVIMITGIGKRQPNIILENVVNIEKELKRINNDTLNSNNLHKTIYVDQSPLLSYLFTISILEYPRNSESIKILSGRSLLSKNTGKISAVIFKTNNKINEYSSNKFNFNYNVDSFINLFEKNKYKNMNLLYDEGFYIPDADFILEKGWNNVETWGAWSNDKIATLKLENKNINSSTFNLIFTLTSWKIDRDVTVSINAVNCGKMKILANIEREYNITCLGVEKNKDLLISLDITDYTESPKKLGVSNDTRYLGIGLKELKIK